MKVLSERIYRTNTVEGMDELPGIADTFMEASKRILADQLGGDDQN